jgi:hypothetical protein
MSKLLHGPPKFSRGPSVVRGPPVGDRWVCIIFSFKMFKVFCELRNLHVVYEVLKNALFDKNWVVCRKTWMIRSSNSFCSCCTQILVILCTFLYMVYPLVVCSRNSHLLKSRRACFLKLGCLMYLFNIYRFWTLHLSEMNFSVFCKDKRL